MFAEIEIMVVLERVNVATAAAPLGARIDAPVGSYIPSPEMGSIPLGTDRVSNDGRLQSPRGVGYLAVRENGATHL